MVIFGRTRKTFTRGLSTRRDAGGTEDPGFHREGVSEGLQENPVRHQGRGAGLAIGAGIDRRPKRDVPVEVGIGIKAVSYLGTERLIHSAIDMRSSTSARA